MKEGGEAEIMSSQSPSLEDRERLLERGGVVAGAGQASERLAEDVSPGSHPVATLGVVYCLVESGHGRLVICLIQRRAAERQQGQALERIP
jgi:hypothetical protein